MIGLDIERLIYALWVGIAAMYLAHVAIQLMRGR